MRINHTRIVAAAGALTLIVAVIAAVTVLARYPSARTVGIAGSYAFDVTDPELVAGYSDAVVIATIGESVATIRMPMVSTVFTGTVLVELKGHLPDGARIVQYGGTAGSTTWIMPDQPGLLAGVTYLLAVRRAEYGYRVVGGPRGAQVLSSPGDVARAQDEWSRHVANQRVPDTTG